MVAVFPRKRPPPPAAKHALAALASTLHSTWLLQSLLLWLVHLDILLEAGPVGGRDMWMGTTLLTVLPGQRRSWGRMFCQGVYTHTHVRGTQDSSVWSRPSSPGSSPDSYRAPKSLRLSHPEPRTCLDHRHFLGRSIYYGSPCGSGGYSHWGKQRTGEPNGRNNKGRRQRGSWGGTSLPWLTSPGEGRTPESHIYLCGLDSAFSGLLSWARTNCSQ